MPAPETIRVRKLPLTLYVLRLPPERPIARWMLEGAFVSVTRTPDELSVIVDEAHLPAGIRGEGPFATFMVEGPLDFSVTGIVARLSAPLAAEGLPIFVTSTFDTDYLLIRAADSDAAAACWRAAGIVVTFQ
ncbi:MAG TPA: ACT domain-containing protein [Luteitalea sp.]|nr:ACT domain-containing protein [Luteitalea sp.]